MALFFASSWRWAGYTNTNRFAAGLTLLLCGLALVGTAILLGG